MPAEIFAAIVAKEGLLLALELARMWSPSPLTTEQLARLEAIGQRKGADYFKPREPMPVN